MASREKRPLAPPKSKQKTNNDSGLPSSDSRNKKGKTLPNSRQEQLARDILEAVATGSQLPPKINANLPRRKALRNLKRKQKFRTAKASLIKAKITKKVPIKSLRKIAPDVKKGIKAKKIRKSDEAETKISEISVKITDNDSDGAENESTGVESIGKGTKGNLRIKKAKSAPKSVEEFDSGNVREKEIDVAIGTNLKSSPKSNKKVKIVNKKSPNTEVDCTEDSKSIDDTDSVTKCTKGLKVTTVKGNTSKERENCIKVAEGEVKGLKGKRNNSKEIDVNISSSKGAGAVDVKSTKSVIENKSSIDLTIDEVIASMLSDSELDDQQRVAEKVEGKLTRSRKTLLSEKLLSDGEMKNESEFDEVRTVSDEDCGESEQGAQLLKVTQSRKRSNCLLTQRSLRNGKLRQLSDSGISADLDVKKRRRLDSDDLIVSDICIEQHTSDDNMDTESCFYESGATEPRGTVVTLTKNDFPLIKDEVQKNLVEVIENGAEIENNNNSEREDRTEEVGPMLRSKTKAKNTDNEIKTDDVKIEDVKSTNIDNQEDSKKVAMNVEQSRKDSALAKLAEKPKSRRSSLNMEMKKTVGSFFSIDKTDGHSKSQIDQMIETIKLTIAKSIESKIYLPEKGLSLNKNFEVPKMEEILAPLSTESQKLGLDENTEEDVPNVSKNEMKSGTLENSVPKVADTAKEIEKLVMGDMEVVDTQSQKTQKDEPSAFELEDSEAPENNYDGFPKPVEECDEEADQNSSATMKISEERMEDTSEEGSFDNGKKIIGLRKSLRISNKCSLENNADSENVKKSDGILDKNIQNSAVVKKIPSDDVEDCSNLNEETLNCETFECNVKANEASLNNSKSNDDRENLTETLSSAEISTTLTSVMVQKKSVKASLPTDRTNESETESCLDVSMHSEESETLESISREVERLVAEGQSKRQTYKIVNSDVQRQEITLNISQNDSYVKNDNEDFVDTANADIEADKFLETLESTFAVSETTAITVENSGALETQESLQNHSEDSKKMTLGVNKDLCKLTEKADENNCHSLTIDGCDPIADCSVTSESQDITDSKEISTKYEESIEYNESSKDANGDYSSSLEQITLNRESKNNVEAVDTKKEKSELVNEKRAVDEQKSSTEESRRVLRTRDKQKKVDTRQKVRSIERNDSKSKVEDDSSEIARHTGVDIDVNDNQGLSSEVRAILEVVQKKRHTEIVRSAIKLEHDTLLEPHVRTRRSREVKRRKEDQQQQQQQQAQSSLKSKRSRRDTRKSEQLNKEETLLDNEVAKINENNRLLVSKYGKSVESTENFRGFSEGGRNRLDRKIQASIDNIRSKSENDLESVKNESEGGSSSRLSQNRLESRTSKRTDIAEVISDNERKTTKTPETLQKDSDEASTSGESSSSVTSKILETPEDKAKKESILRLLGLESLEKAAERMNHQKARKEQYTGTLKTVIRVQKEKDKKRSRSPLRMVLKQGRGDGDGDSPEFYTIQKEFGTSGLGDSSSGANRKFTTNHRHSCDEDNEEVSSKDRQSLVIPEKSSSFSIHPGRLCADVCCYCFGKFGSLDTPMHLAQMKSDERRKKILYIERHLTKDSCLCDACYRHVDRKANATPTNVQTKPPRQHRQLMVSKCSARECRDPARHHVKRRWLLKIKTGLQDQVTINWESSQHTSMSFCANHYSKIERFLTCALCKRRLARNHTHQLVIAETEELNQRLGQQGIPVPLAAGTFVCKLCRYFTQLQLKYKNVENMNTNHRSFFKSYRKRILHYHDIEILDNEEDEESPLPVILTKDREKRKRAKYNQGKASNSKSSDGTTNSASEKSTPEPSKNEGANSETDNENRTSKIGTSDNGITADVQILGIESTVEKLKKRNLLDVRSYSTNSTLSCDGTGEMLEIVAMDKEVTLTRLPKRVRTNNDISPVVQRLGANPSISVRTLFPGEEEMNLHANVEFNNVREVTPQGWEKCATMIQYDRDTKLLWQELQRPYGNQSSFLRHLILLEKYYRSGDLVLAPNASRNAINYSTSVQNRLISYEGPEKMDEPIMEPISSEFSNSRRLSGGYVLERDRLSLQSTSTLISASCNVVPSTSQLGSKINSPRLLKLHPGVSIIKKPPPSLQRLNLPSTSTANSGGSSKRRDPGNRMPVSSGGKVFQLSEPDFKRLQNFKRQKQSSSPGTTSPSGYKPATQYQKAQIAAQTQFQKHLRMQQEMLNRQSRGDFEPLICDMRSLANESNSTQSLLNNLNLPKSIQVTTKPTNPIPILPKIPKSLTVIPQTITRPAGK